LNLSDFSSGNVVVPTLLADRLGRIDALRLNPLVSVAVLVAR
jgi:hypothetical protein